MSMLKMGHEVNCALAGGPRRPIIVKANVPFGLGLSNRLAAIRTIEQSRVDIARDPASALGCLVEACNACANKDGADSVILGGARLSGLAARVQGSVPVPV